MLGIINDQKHNQEEWKNLLIKMQNFRRQALEDYSPHTPVEKAHYQAVKTLYENIRDEAKKLNAEMKELEAIAKTGTPIRLT